MLVGELLQTLTVDRDQWETYILTKVLRYVSLAESWMEWLTNNQQLAFEALELLSTGPIGTSSNKVAQSPPTEGTASVVGFS